MKKEAERTDYILALSRITMSTENIANNSGMNDITNEAQEAFTPIPNMDTASSEVAEAVNIPEPEAEPIPSMDEFKDQLEHSFRKLKEGDIIKGTVIGISETEVVLDLGYYTEGIIKLEELSNDPRFSIKADVTMGEEIQAVILEEDDGQGHILLSKKRADDIIAWDQLTDLLNNRTVVKVKIAQAVKGGVVTYLYGIRAFIPASQLSISYVEDLETWVGKELDVIVINASEADKKLLLSGKEVEKDLLQKEKKNRLNKLQLGIITKGRVEKIAPYGAFVNIGEGLTGLLHISQISDKRIKSPNEVLKEGDEVTVKIIDIKDGKISLSKKAVDQEEEKEALDIAEDAPLSYSTGEEATTGLGELLKNIKL